jgi:hypothetical protein
LVTASYILVLVSPVYAEANLFTKPMDSLTQYRDRPLFSSSRRSVPVVEPADENTAPIATQPLNAVLLGLVSSSDGNGVVVLRVDGQAEAQRVRIGESVNGWQLDRIETRNAMFSSDGQTVTLTFPLNTDENGTAIDGGVVDAPMNPVFLPTPDPKEP